MRTADDYVRLFMEAYEHGENLAPVIAAAMAEARAEGDKAGFARGVEAALRMDHPWSVPETLTRLADAADHLLSDHDCDSHGWEGAAFARDAAREALVAIRALALAAPADDKEV